MQTGVWDSLHIVTNPDVRVGRRGSRVDICEFGLLCFIAVSYLTDRSTAQDGRRNGRSTSAHNTRR